MNSIIVKNLINRHLLGASAAIIIVLLSANIVISSINRDIMNENRQLEKQTEQVKKAVFQSLYLIHNADLALRGYVAFKDSRYLPPLQFAYEDRDSIYQTIEVPLSLQNYPLEEFNKLKDSINVYLDQCTRMKDLFDRNQLTEFNRLANEDKGYHLWLQYDQFNKRICRFEDTINEQAQQRYNDAQNSNHLIQCLLVIFCIPTLLFTVFYTYKQVSTAKKLRDAQRENIHLLAEQNEKLEGTVKERTALIMNKQQELKEQYQQILEKNTQLARQREELVWQQEELVWQNNALVQAKKQQLESYVESIREKNEIIEAIQGKLNELKGREQVETDFIENFDIILRSTILTEEAWQKYKTTFESVYPHFFATLRYCYPHITDAEQRLAALIKLNLSLKECANTLGIAPESVRKARHRLKKRFHLTETDNIEVFIQNLSMKATC
ncbi:hypothetical protein QNI16_37670 [Cytophagaceae bacterium YF14B1]|uniref:Transcriptional regulator n=1 Tax=Xanthocytophaga flava TaxID=3048013 RepID=A0AAE3UBZ2_9BACT|nr:hypothetical protein [Xanthocytophaga flavus]MDJ1486272.1 hypothetical protein [Xanthocytophaga flavus]